MTKRFIWPLVCARGGDVDFWGRRGLIAFEEKQFNIYNLNNLFRLD